MVFSSYSFLLLFLPLTLAGFYGLRALGLRAHSVTFLLLASFAFYANWRLSHLALLIFSIGVNFLIGRYAASEATHGARKLATTLGVLFNLSLIFWFKYLDFALGNVAAVTGVTHTFQNIILPLGISFFTFQQIAYLVDCYTQRDAEKNPRDYALFVSFFPQLIAGPIVHHRFTRPQFAALTRAPVDLNNVVYGLMIFAMGLAKKALIADPIARAIDPIYASAAAGASLDAGASLVAIVGYTLQIYFDFSGYCDMAIGLGLMVGVRLPVNFNSPYKSASIIEFWRRWHMTLSAFLRDYVYIPLGGDAREKNGRGGQFFRLRNIFLTMLIGGVWHGAAWTFVIWGAIHAALITANHAARLYLPHLDALTGAFAMTVKRGATLCAVMLAWVYFRADGIDAAHAVFAGLGVGALSAPVSASVLALIVIASALALFAPNSLDVAGYAADPSKRLPVGGRVQSLLKPTPLSAAATALMITGGLAVAWKPAIFIYFNF